MKFPSDKKTRILLLTATAAILVIAAVVFLCIRSRSPLSQYRTRDEVQARIDEIMPAFDCWGDSITEGFLGEGVTYPDTLRDIMDRELIQPIRDKTGYADLETPVVRNMGVSSESTTEIGGRRGAIPFVLIEDVDIPADKESVRIRFASSMFEDVVKPLRAGDGTWGDNGINPVTLAGVEGQLIRYFDPEVDHSRYLFERSTAGEAVHAKAGEKLVTDATDKYAEDYCVILMGANGVYLSPENLAEQFHCMVDVQKNPHYLVIGMGHPENNTGLMTPEEAKAVADDFGDRCIILQHWMSENGIETANRYFDAGITPTETDEARMAEGYPPLSLMNEDELHYTPVGYRVIARMVFDKMDALGDFDELRALAGK